MLFRELMAYEADHNFSRDMTQVTMMRVLRSWSRARSPDRLLIFYGGVTAMVESVKGSLLFSPKEKASDVDEHQVI